jgi:hypothetical protein
MEIGCGAGAEHEKAVAVYVSPVSFKATATYPVIVSPPLSKVVVLASVVGYCQFTDTLDEVPSTFAALIFRGAPGGPSGVP